MFRGWGGSGSNSGDDDKNDGPKSAESYVPSSTSSSNSSKSVHGFDSSSLERAAEAAKKLEKDRNAKEILRNQYQLEITKQKEAERDRARFQVQQQEVARQRIQEEEQSNARLMEHQRKENQKQAEYQDQLEKKRYAEKIQAQRKINEEERGKAEESLRRQEEMRRKTLEHEAALRQQTEMAKVRAEGEAKTMQERQNHDLIMEKKVAEAKEFRTTVLEGIKTFGTTFGNGVKEFTEDKQKLTNTVVSLTLLAAGIYTAKIGTGVAGRIIEARLGKPSLVRETSKKNALQYIINPIQSAKLLFESKDGATAMKDIVVNNQLKSRLQNIAKSTANTKANKAPYRHLLLHGPPGTGKTMFAKGLAKESGLHYAIMTGGDVAPLGKDAVTEIHKMFDWANTTQKGVLLFVDEADAFLRKRSSEKISEDLRNALNAFLYRTGEASKKFMVVFASNQPEQLDWAITDRIDDMVMMGLPDLDERVGMLIQYLQQYILDPKDGAKAITGTLEEEKIMEYAKATEGFSGREISKLVIAWQAASYGTDNASIDTELFDEVLKNFMQQKREKSSWISKTEANKLTNDA